MKTESNLRPAARYEIEAPAKIEGRICTVIFYENIAGPFTRESGQEETEQYFTYDRYAKDVPYRENLKETIDADPEGWMEAAKAEEETGEELTDKEKIAALEKEVETLRAEKEEINGILDDLIIAQLGGADNV